MHLETWSARKRQSARALMRPFCKSIKIQKHTKDKEWITVQVRISQQDLPVYMDLPHLEPPPPNLPVLQSLQKSIILTSLFLQDKII